MSINGRVIYFMKPKGLKGPIKIGHTCMPEHRLTVLSCWSPFELEIVATCDGDNSDEYKLHLKFEKFRLHQEWFLPCEELLDGIEKVKVGIPLNRSFSDIDNTEGKKQRKLKLHSYSWEEQIKMMGLEPGVIAWSDFDRVHSELRK